MFKWMRITVIITISFFSFFGPVNRAFSLEDGIIAIVNDDIITLKDA